MTKKHIEIYTDGACKGNPGPGGWAALLRHGKNEKEISGYMANTTNNQMELLAVIEAFKTLKSSCKIDLYTDSQYVQKGMLEWLENWKKRGWKTAAKKPVKNVEFWQNLDELSQKHDISWHWVRGHSGHPENERVDQLAQDACYGKAK